MPFEDVLVHRAVPLITTEAGVWVEGDRMAEPEEGTPFDCVVFLPQGTEPAEKRRRGVREPTLLVSAENDLGEPVALSAEDELLITAPELNVAEGKPADAQQRWTITGAGQLFGKPGDEPIGAQFTIRQVSE